MRNALIPRLCRFSSLTAALIVLAMPALAQDKGQELPKLPDPLQNLVDEGAQIRYLGREHGMDGWITIKNGQEQYFYVKPDQSAFVMGILFDDKGKAITVDQVKNLRGEDGDPLLDTLTGSASESKESKQPPAKLQTPSERMFTDIENSNWIPMGEIGAPVVYTFMDPQCPHCHSFMEDLRKGYLEKGRVQVRMVPVGFKQESRAQAAFLLAAPNPQERWMRHLDGDKEALPAKEGISDQGVQKNLTIMQSWKFDVTPMTIYRGKDGKVKIVRGKPKDLDALIADIGDRG